jgi:multiple sugar transport system ATP-binding protein
MAEVVLDKVNKLYDNGFHAVQDLDLDIADGEFLVLVGPSGCGKSTALRMVAGLEDISSGTMRIGDRVVNTLSPKDRDIAMVFQSYALYPHMSVADNIAYGLRIRRMDKAEIDQRVKKVADMLELAPLLDRKPKQLSGGQRQRVAMGRAIVREPQVFLMDEPLSNLDAKLRVQMRAEIAQVQRDLDVTTIYVTHDQTEAMTMGDRVAVLKAGILQEVGDPQYLYDNPANIFVAGFIGSPPMNMAVGKVARDGDDLVVRLGSATIRLHPAVAAQRPGLAAYVARDVAVGIRSEDMEDARLVRDAPADTRLKAEVSLVEALGAQIVVHFEVDAPKVVTEDTKLLEKDAHTDEAPAHEEIQGTKFVASFAPRSRVRAGDQIEVVIDTERMHFFDPQTGAAIRE